MRYGLLGESARASSSLGDWAIETRILTLTHPTTHVRLRATRVPGPFTEVPTLPNGLIVATESHPHVQTVTVGVWIDAGSRTETDTTTAPHTSGTHGVQGTHRRSQQALGLGVEEHAPRTTNAYNSRKQTVYYAKRLSRTSPRSWTSSRTYCRTQNWRREKLSATGCHFA